LDPVSVWERHSMLKMRFGEVPVTEVKMPSPVGTVVRSSK
jgi:hypothetical protein